MPTKNVVAQKGLVVLPPWSLRRSKKHEGRWYFYNTDSKESAWTLSPEFISTAEEPIEPNEPPPDVVAIGPVGVQFPILPTSPNLSNDVEAAGNRGQSSNSSNRNASNTLSGSKFQAKSPPQLNSPWHSPLFYKHQNQPQGTASPGMGRSSSVQTMGSSFLPQGVIPSPQPPANNAAEESGQNDFHLPRPISPNSPATASWARPHNTGSTLLSLQAAMQKSQSTDSFRGAHPTFGRPTPNGSLLVNPQSERLRLLSSNNPDEAQSSGLTESPSDVSLPYFSLSQQQLSPMLTSTDMSTTTPDYDLGENDSVSSTVSSGSGTTGSSGPATSLMKAGSFGDENKEAAPQARFKVTNGLGSGGYSVVVLVEDSETSQPYAMKVIQKARLTRSHDRRRIRNELKVLQTLKPCAFLAHCVSAFESKERIFFVMEFNSGGDLFYHLVRRVNESNTGFKEDEVRILLAEVLLGLEHLHNHGYVHRDIKVENIMLDSRGHVKLIDFGLVFELKNGTELKEGTLGEPMSPTGSLIYMAPELLQHRLGGRHTDWWALGVLAHELLTGRTPWSSLTNKKTIQREISGMRVSPPSGLSPAAGLFVCALLHQNPKLRLGTTTSVRSASFFSPIDWELAENLGLPPALAPSTEILYSGSVGPSFDSDESAEVLNTYLAGCEKAPSKAGQCVSRTSGGRDPVPSEKLFTLGLPNVLMSPELLTEKPREAQFTWDDDDDTSEDMSRRRSTSVNGGSSWPSPSTPAAVKKP